MAFNGTCIGRYSPEWSTSAYILKWLSVKIPLLVLFFLSISFLASVRHLIRTRYCFLSKEYIPILLQLILLPFLAVAGNSNLYDADRHLLFIYPPMIILSLEFTRFRMSRFESLFLMFASVSLALILFIDGLSLSPYGTAYLNEPSRFFLNHTNTAIDYWATSSKEAINKAQLQGNLPVNPTLSTGLWISPLWIGYRQLAGQMNSALDHELRIRLRDPNTFSRSNSNCKHLATVSRSLILMPQPLVLSELDLCKKG